MAVFQHVAAIRQLQRLVGVLLDEENGGAVGIDFFDDGKNLLDDDRREAEGRLIKQDPDFPAR